jgi:hypothetical protein
MAAPEFLICLECETPCYIFEWQGGKLKEVLCAACGNEDPESFLSEEEMDQLISAD